MQHIKKKNTYQKNECINIDEEKFLLIGSKRGSKMNLKLSNIPAKLSQEALPKRQKQNWR